MGYVDLVLKDTGTLLLHTTLLIMGQKILIIVNNTVGVVEVEVEAPHIGQETVVAMLRQKNMKDILHLNEVLFVCQLFPISYP